MKSSSLGVLHISHVELKKGEELPSVVDGKHNCRAGGALARAPASKPQPRTAGDRIRVDGKFPAGRDKWFVKGVTYGPFAPDHAGIFLPPRRRPSRSEPNS